MRGRKPLQREPYPVCTECGKWSYPSRRAALRHIKYLERRDTRVKKDVTGLMAYRCPEGAGWHTGHGGKRR